MFKCIRNLTLAAVCGIAALGFGGNFAQAANPCAPKAENPCAPKAGNPCAPKPMDDKKAANPCAPKGANPCAPKK